MRKDSEKIKVFKKNSRGIIAFFVIFFGFLILPNATHAFGIPFYDLPNATSIMAAIVNKLLEFVALLTGLAGMILNKTLQYTVVNMSVNTVGISGIVIAWGVIRDLINMSFIFILLYIAIGTILDIGVNWKSTLIKVIVAAVLINFSLFFTRIVIDASNILAVTFYNQMVTPAQIAAGEGLADSFAGPLKITTLYTGSASNPGGLTAGSLVTIGLMGSIFLIIVAFVFLAASLLFISRFVTLIFLLILSPIGFFGTVLPGLGSAAKKWRDTLIGQAIFAPIYMILTWIVLVIINDPNFLTKNATGSMGDTLSHLQSTTQTSSQFAAYQGAFDIFLNFIIIIVFMIGTLIISKSAASQGVNLGQKVVGSAAGLAVGAGGWAGRKSLGRMGKSISDNEYLKSKAPNSRMARLALQGGNKFAKGSYDFRESQFANMGKKMGVDMDLGIGGKSGGKGGYDAYLKEQAKKEKEFGESLKPSDIAMDEAKQAVERAKTSEVSDQEYKDEFVKRKNREREAQRKADLAMGELREYEEQIRTKSLKVDPEIVARQRKKVEDANNELREAQTMARAPISKLKQKIKDERVKQSQDKLDQLQGVNEDEAKKRIQAEKQLNDADWKKFIASDEGKKAIKDRQMKSAGDARKEAYAQDLSQALPISTKRVFFVGKVEKRYKQAAADLRKGKKPLKDQIEQIMKEAGETPKKEESAEATPETPPATPKP